MRPKFEPDSQAASNPNPASMWVDPEACDASEDQFAASLEESPKPKFEVEEKSQDSQNAGQASLNVRLAILPAESSEPGGPESASAQGELLPSPDPDAWRQEVAAKLDNYRSRRKPRAPRYPSLKLKFEPNEPASSESEWSNADNVQTQRPATRQAITMQSALANPIIEAEPSQAIPNYPPRQAPSPEPTARVIEFPRSTNTPPRRSDELADPVIDRPRILEAPELVMPPPALGGILIEPVEVPASERRPGFEMPLQSAPLGRRFAAAAVDAVIVLTAVIGFAYIVFRMTGTIPLPQPGLAMAALVVAAFWAGYQYLSLVYTGSTPGLWIARLQVNLFDGSPVPRKIRRWRVLASILSGLSLGLGYAWCFLDEDQLCWHDRITRTYMAPRK